MVRPVSAGARVLEQGGPWTVLGDTWRARKARAYNGGLGAEPPAGFRGGAPGQGVRGGKAFASPEAESFLALGRAMDTANLYFLQYFQQSITTR